MKQEKITLGNMIEDAGALLGTTPIIAEHKVRNKKSKGY